MNTEDLINKAASLVQARTVDGFTSADVGCVMVSAQNKVYTGVCIDTSSGMGFCTEHNAIGAMVTAGEYRIQTIVAVWKAPEGDLYVLAPCGRYREFMYRIHPDNLDTDVILGRDTLVKLKDLLPYHDWFCKV
jgi:cytidine deaminase